MTSVCFPKLHPAKMGSTLTGRNLLLEEQILSRVDPDSETGRVPSLEIIPIHLDTLILIIFHKIGISVNTGQAVLVSLFLLD